MDSFSEKVGGLAKSLVNRDLKSVVRFIYINRFSLNITSRSEELKILRKLMDTLAEDEMEGERLLFEGLVPPTTTDIVDGEKCAWSSVSHVIVLLRPCLRRDFIDTLLRACTERQTHFIFSMTHSDTVSELVKNNKEFLNFDALQNALKFDDSRSLYALKALRSQAALSMETKHLVFEALFFRRMAVKSEAYSLLKKQTSKREIEELFNNRGINLSETKDERVLWREIWELVRVVQ